MMFRTVFAAIGVCFVVLWIAGNVLPGINFGVYVGPKPQVCFNFR